MFLARVDYINNRKKRVSAENGSSLEFFWLQLRNYLP
ncbi:hypothetical protein M493_05270 [Geobacillus genomosp. 3]|uniref:Uncharacterized protein n=1 Tax=Geobacillus genomosp. 3 TaxID=1921421 RepID=S5ZLX8_GEOG3|nr:hypothetical protein M493_05270 [Geobacillus genomosp. 3]